MNNSPDLKARIGSFVKVSDSIGEITLNGTNDATVEEVRKFTLDINELMNYKPFY
jgi:hypothetical protein